MKKIIFILSLLLVQQVFAQKEIRFAGGINFSKPKTNFEQYKKDIDIEGAISVVLGKLKYSKNQSVLIEPMLRLKRYHLEAINILRTDYYISAADIGVRLYPFYNDFKGNTLQKIASLLYADIAYSSVKFVKANIPVDVKRTMISYGYGICVPLKDMSDLGINSTLMASAGVTQYSWKNSIGTTSSFAGKNISLIFAINLGKKNKS